MTADVVVRQERGGWIIELHNSVMLDESLWSEFARAAGCAEGKMPKVIVRRVPPALIKGLMRKTYDLG
jgi:hypothetical protein